MRQRECAGFNWPPFSIPAEEPVSISPETVSRAEVARFACRGNWSNRSEPSALGLMSTPLSFQSLVVVVTHPANAASAGSAPPAWFGPPCDPSVALGVFHPAR